MGFEGRGNLSIIKILFDIAVVGVLSLPVEPSK